MAKLKPGEYLVQVPQIHYQERVVAGASSPREAVYMATKLGQYKNAGLQYAGQAVLTEVESLSVHDHNCNEVLSITDDTEVPQNQKEVSVMPPFQKKEIAPTGGGKIAVLGKTLLGDAQDAAWRVGAGEFVDNVKEPLAAALMDQVGVTEHSFIRGAVGKFLKTRAGDGAVSFALASAMPLIERTLPPDMRPHATRMGKELRVRGMTELLEPVVKAITKPVRDVMVAHIEQLRANEIPVEEIAPPAETPSEKEIVVASTQTAAAA